MKRFFNAEIVTAGLAVFSMFFGAGNLMFPIRVGLVAGDKIPWAMLGFSLSAVLLPLIGLIGIILFQGDYTSFFYRIGRIPGFLFLFFCVNIIGPITAMPRIVTLSHTVIEPFAPFMSPATFSIIFLSLTFLATYKESKIIDLLGRIISPLLLISLFIIIIKGYITGLNFTTTEQVESTMFWENLVFGYQTLDLLGGIFFSSILITILQKSKSVSENNFKQLALFCLKSGLIGVGFLGLIYLGLSYIGAYFGHGLENINPGKLFSAVSFKIMGTHGALIIALAVLMACFSTIIALAAIYAEFLNIQIFRGRLGYFRALVITLALTLVSSIFGLDFILTSSKPLIIITYPALVVLTLANIAYKLFNFTYIKTPVAITLIISLVLYIYPMIVPLLV